MATLYVTEFNSPNIGVNPNQLGVQAPVAEQTVTFTTTTQSNAFNPGTNLVRIHPDGICSIEFGTNPTATTAKARMTAGSTEYFVVPQGQSYKVAAVTNT
jgi:hypothetical protein